MSTRAIVGYKRSDGTVVGAWCWNDGYDIKNDLKRDFKSLLDVNFLLAPDPRSILLCIVQKCFVSCHFPSFFTIITPHIKNLFNILDIFRIKHNHRVNSQNIMGGIETSIHEFFLNCSNSNSGVFTPGSRIVPP